jgi:hypothetical protein
MMIDQWAGCLDPRIAAHRRRTHATGLALEEMRQVSSVGSGLRRLFREGSLTWLLSRPFVHAVRRVRRKVCRPLWEENFT